MCKRILICHWFITLYILCKRLKYEYIQTLYKMIVPIITNPFRSRFPELKDQFVSGDIESVSQ